MGLDMGAFNRAWGLLKANPQDQVRDYPQGDDRTIHPSVKEHADRSLGHRLEGLPLEDYPRDRRAYNEERNKLIQLQTPPSPFPDIGRAGSSIPPGRDFDPRYLFNPFKYGSNNPSTLTSFTAQFDPVGRQPPRDGLKEYSESLEQTPLGQALTQARSQPPQPLQFEKAWATLKALPEQQVLGPDDQPLKTLHPAIQGMMERRGTLQPEGQEIQNKGHIKSWHPLHDPRTPEEIENRVPANYDETVYPEIGVPGKELREGERFHEGKERLTRERNEAIPTEGALQGGYRTSMRPQTDLTISEGYPYEIPERQIYRREEGYPEYATDRHPYTARFASMYGEPETMDEKFKYGYGRFMGR